MKRKLLLTGLVCALMLAGCGETDSGSASESSSAAETSAAETTAAETSAEEKTETTAAESEAGDSNEKKLAPQQEVGYEGMEAIGGDKLKDGEYKITVDSSSSMFKITECLLTVSGGQMTAKMTMSGTGYECLYMGTEEQAAAADESERIPFEEQDGVHSFTVPVEALDKEIDCAALSKKKQEWYGRKLVFRADSLPSDAFAEGVVVTAEALGLEDGEYTVSVTLEGGSGKASVQSPARLIIRDGEAFAELIWNSKNYDYMIVEGEKYLPVNVEEASVFEIPVTGFDYRMPVSADTIAMSEPHEIEYTLYFDSVTIEAVK